MGGEKLLALGVQVMQGGYTVKVEAGRRQKVAGIIPTPTHLHDTEPVSSYKKWGANLPLPRFGKSWNSLDSSVPPHPTMALPPILPPHLTPESPAELWRVN